MIRAVTALGQAARARQVTPVARPGRSRVRKARAGHAARVRPDRTSRKGSRGEQQAPEDDRAMRRPHIPRAGTRARCAATSKRARLDHRRAGAPRRGLPDRSSLESPRLLCKHPNNDGGSTIDAHSHSYVVGRYPLERNLLAPPRYTRQTTLTLRVGAAALWSLEESAPHHSANSSGLSALDLAG